MTSTATAGTVVTLTATASGGKDGGTGRFVSDTFTVTVATVTDPCASVSAPVAPAFSAGTPNGSDGWFTTVPSAAASSTTSDATISYSTDNGATFGALPTLGQGTTTVISRATSATCNKTTDTSRTFKVDTLAPGADLDNLTSTTWRNSSLSRTFTFSDSGSGLASNIRLDSTNMVTLTASAQSTDASTPTADSITVYDLAGNSTTRTVSALIDLAKPTISGAVSSPLGGPDGNNSWYKTAPTVTFTCGDALSNIFSCLADDVTPAASSTILGESANAQTVTGTATDNAGNTETASVSGLKVDLTNPAVTCSTTAPAFLLNGAGSVTGSVTDGASGPLSTTASASASTGALGSNSATVTGYDNAGRSASTSCSYTVSGQSTGFTAPVDRAPTVNKAKVGRTVPLKWRVTDANNIGYAGLTNSQVSVRLDGNSTCTNSAATDEVEMYSTTTSGLQNLGDGYYQIDWKTPSTTGCRTVTVVMPGGNGPTAVFSFIK